MQLSFEMIKQMKNIRLEGSSLVAATQKPTVKRLYFFPQYPKCRIELRTLFPYLTEASQIGSFYVKTKVYKMT